LKKKLAAAAKRAGLSPRETEAVQHLAAGLPRKAIADQMKISQRTVDVYLSRALLKTQCQTALRMLVMLMQEPG